MNQEKEKNKKASENVVNKAEQKSADLSQNTISSSDNNDNKINKPKKKHRVLKIGIATVLVGVTLFFVTNYIRAKQLNQDPPVQNPHTTEDVFDKNDNDFDIGEDGQIVIDDITKEEKDVLKDKLQSIILKDANSKSSTNIENIKDLLSISLMPYNLCDENNEFDKYYLSLLFKDNKDKLYTLNYLTGKDFESSKEISKDKFIEFINYLNYECALDTCQQMNEKGEKIKSLFDDEIAYVGDAYLGYKESGDEYYYVPIYKTNGGGSVFYSWINDSYGLDPMDKLFNELNTDDKQDFQMMEFTKSENLQNILQIYKNLFNNTENTTNENNQ